MILPLALVSQLAASCAPGVAPETLQAVARVESHFDPLAISDFSAHRSYWPPDLQAAIAQANTLRGAGHGIAIGLMQISAGNFDLLGLTVESAFDPCHSLAAAARLMRIYSTYNTGNPRQGITNGYAQKVMVAEANLTGTQAKGDSGTPAGTAAPVVNYAKPNTFLGPAPTEPGLTFATR
jgi:type IV secretion system protein VirB1